MEDEYFDISLDDDDTIFKKFEFYWFITQIDNTFWVECYFPDLKLSASYKDFFGNFKNAFNYGKENWGSFLYNEESNELE